MIFTEPILESLRESFERVCRDFEAELAELEAGDDYVHLLVTYPPKLALAKLINSLKGVSTRVLRRDHPEIEPHLVERHLWARAYFAGSVGGPPLDVLWDYLRSVDRGR